MFRYSKNESNLLQQRVRHVFSLMNTYNTKTPTIENYDEYKHAGVTDKQIQEKYSMNDMELDKLIFTNYEKFKLVMEKNSKPQRKKKKT